MGETAVTRPPPAWTPQPGYEFVAVVETGWRLVDPLRATRRCRWGAGGGGPGCGKPAVAEMNRGRHDWRAGVRRDSWWAYCGAHLYGRWIEDAQVKWVTRKAGE